MRLRLFVSLAGLSTLSVALYATLLAFGASLPATIAVVLAAVLAAGLAWWLHRPIRRATDFASAMARGATPPRLREDRPGGLAGLYHALNRSAENYRERLAELGEEEQETELLLQEMGEGVLALNPAGRVVRANAQMYRLIGANEPIEGRAVGTLFRNPQLVAFLSPSRVSAGGATGEFQAFDRTMLVTARRLPSGGVVAVFSDLTLLKRLDTIRTEFVANASHELKTPLTAIRGFAETLTDSAVLEKDRKIFAARIVEHSNRMNAIVEDLLTLARLEQPDLEAKREALALEPLIDDTVGDLAERLRTGGMSVRIEVTPSGLEVLGDPEGIRRVLENLIDNALRHSGGDTVTVRAQERESGKVRLSVEDNGQGIPTADLVRIFERFYRVDPSRSRATGGTGLGLSIVKHWVGAMYGRVWADASVGQGTRIHVMLPSPGSPDRAAKKVDSSAQLP